MRPPTRYLSLVIVGLVVVACKTTAKANPVPDAAPVEVKPQDSAEQPSTELPQPKLSELRQTVAKMIPELQENIKAGRGKKRAITNSCIVDLRSRHDRLNGMLRGTFGRSWFSWDEPQRDIADDFENVIIHLRGCVDCAPDDVKDCDTASTSLTKLKNTLAGKSPH